MDESASSADRKLDHFVALALQVRCEAINRAGSRSEARSVMAARLQTLAPQISAARAFIGSDCRLILLPEYLLTGFPMGEPLATWRDKACLEMNDSIYDGLAAIAQEQRIFLAGNAYEVDPLFPDLYFQTCFVFDPSGTMVLRYRRLNSMFAPTPHDVWQPYLDHYGIEGVFPVARTEIGNLAALASEEILFPEVSRCLALRGAEVLLHPTSELHGRARSAKESAKVCRAVENMLYVISANTAGISNTPILEDSVNGGSKIIDYRGLVLCETGPGESMTAFAEIDLAAQRRYRHRGGMGNLLARQRLELYAPIYGEMSIVPPNSLLSGTPERSHFNQAQQQVIEMLDQRNVI